MARVMFAKGRLSWACEREVLVSKITASLEDSKSQGSFFSVFLVFTFIYSCTGLTFSDIF